MKRQVLYIRELSRRVAVAAAVIIYMICPASSGATGVHSEPDVADNDADVRTGVVEITSGNNNDEAEELEIMAHVPSFIRLQDNRIEFNGADWSGLRMALEDCEADPFTIVHIGDSHIQADFATGVIRELLQYEYGDAGRGVVTPLRLSGTNQPSDYYFTSRDKWKAQKLMKQPWKMSMGFTGTSISPVKTSTNITIGTRVTDEDYDPFVSVTLFHHGRMKINSITDAEGKALKYTDFPSRDYTQVVFDSEYTEVTINITVAADFALYGMSLSGERPGVFYHAIGNNGATYGVYNNIGTMGRGIAPLKPELVIISLGTNEAFGKVNSATLYDNIDALVTDIRQANPEARILLVTPMECQKSVYTTRNRQVKVPVKSSGKRSKKGSRRKTRTVNKQVRVRTGSYVTNTAVATVRDVIKKYGADNHVAVYDWYDVAGGDGAAAKWIANGLFGKDRVHHTVKGYNLQGRLLYDALHKALGSDSAEGSEDVLVP